MAAEFHLTRNQLITNVLRKLKAVSPGEQPSYNLTQSGVWALNSILREEDNEQTGEKRSLWALKEAHLFMQVGGYVYGVNEGLASDILDLQTVKFRDTSGDESAVTILSPSQYERLTPKNQTGDVTRAMLKEDKD